MRILIAFLLPLILLSQNCSNPLLNYDIFDNIIFLDNATLLTGSLGLCSLTSGVYSCCSDLNANDIGVVYDKFKSRIEDYNSDWILNFKNIFNPFLDLSSMGITTSDYPNLSTDLKSLIMEYRKIAKSLNKLQSKCVSVAVQTFAGTLCMLCDPNYSSYITILNPEQSNTSLSNYRITFSQSNCDTIYNNCYEYLEMRKNMEYTIYKYLAQLVDILTMYIGEMPYANITLISSQFTNASALTDPNMKRILSETSCETNETESHELFSLQEFNYPPNEDDLSVEDEQSLEEGLEDYANMTTVTSSHNLDLIARSLKSSGGRGGGGGRSSGSKSSGRSSSSSSSSSSRSSSSSSGSSGGRSTGSSSSSTSGAGGGRSTYSTRTNYGARSSTASTTVKSSSTARSNFKSRSSTSSVYSSSYYTTTSRTYSSSRTGYVIIYSSWYGTRYRGYYNQKTYGTSSKTLTTAATSDGMEFTIKSIDEWQGIISPFYSGTTLPSDITTQETNYHKAYIDWINSAQIGGTLIENCPTGMAKCRVCNLNGCIYLSKVTSESYDKYCIAETANLKTAFICNLCIGESCDLEIVLSGPPTGTQFPLVLKYMNNRFTTNSASANIKSSSQETTVTDDQAIASFKSNPRYSPRTRRVLPSDVALPNIDIPTYSSPCSNSSTCQAWMCSKFFDGIVPEASKLANPQENSRSSQTDFVNTTQQTVSVIFAAGGLDAYGKGANSSLNATAMIDNVNIWSSDDADPL